MLFSGLTFLLYFLPLTLALYFVRPGIRWRNGVLLAASLLFYAWGRPVWLLGMLFSAFVNYLCALGMHGAKGSQRRIMLLFGVGAALALLFAFKYLAFFVNTLLGLVSSVKMMPLELPIGISFYTFQIITYTVDVYRGKQAPQRNFAQLLLYVSCFPQLIAGPIVRYGDVAKQIKARRSTPDGFSQGTLRFCAGLAKKALAANVCAQILEKLPLAGAGSLSFLGAWYAAAIYTLQIYFDFSGYSDMAIGLGRIFGFSYRENFDHPYWASSVRDFWRRWHISLGAFFREYVYIPLGGNRAGLKRTIINTLAVWTLTGLWHGASWTFIVWGLYYGALLTVDLLGGNKLSAKLPGFVNRIITLILVMFGWVIFYYPTIGQGLSHIGAMLGFGSGFLDASARDVIRAYSVLPLIFFALSLPLGKWLLDIFKRFKISPKLWNGLKAGLAILVAVLSLVFIEGLSSNPFIYFQF